MAYTNVGGWVPVREVSTRVAPRKWAAQNAPRIGLAIWIGLILAAKLAGVLG